MCQLEKATFFVVVFKQTLFLEQFFGFTAKLHRRCRDFLLTPHLYTHICCSSLVTKLCLTFCNPSDYSPPGSSVHGTSQVRILERVAIPFSQGNSRPRDGTKSLVFQTDSLPLSHLHDLPHNHHPPPEWKQLLLIYALRYVQPNCVLKVECLYFFFFFNPFPLKSSQLTFSPLSLRAQLASLFRAKDWRERLILAFFVGRVFTLPRASHPLLTIDFNGFCWSFLVHLSAIKQRSLQPLQEFQSYENSENASWEMTSLFGKDQRVSLGLISAHPSFGIATFLTTQEKKKKIPSEIPPLPTPKCWDNDIQIHGLMNISLRRSIVAGPSLPLKTETTSLHLVFTLKGHLLF